jgi:UDP-glucuronate 4-epimerase
MTTGPILVTGAAGLIGSRLVSRLAAEGADVIATDRRVAEAPRVARWVTVDLMDGGALTALMREARVGTVVHAGAISGPMVAVGDPHQVMSVNVGGALNIAEAALRTGVERLIALSSAGVYGAQASLDPVPEDAPLNASDIYGASKIAAETVFRAYRRDHGLPAIALRPSSVYGPGRITACFIRDMIDHARRGDPLALAPVGACRRQFVHVDDVVAAIMGALNAPRLDHFAFNVSGGTWLSEQEIVALAAPGLPGLRIASIAAPARCLDGEMGPLDTARAQAPLVILRPFPSRRASPPTPPPSARARAARLPLASSLLSFVRSFGRAKGLLVD